MEKVLNYTLIKQIGETSKSTIYKAKKDSEDKTVIIKSLNISYPSASEIARFKQEFELVRKLDIDGIIKVIDILELNDKYYIIQEDTNYTTLKALIKNNKLGIRQFLEIAVPLSDILGSIHKNNIIHRNIKPQNILIDEKKKKVKITNFNIGNLLTHENEEIYNPFVIEETLPYISPEQTGRMNRTVDYRTDLYSLGVTFYEMLTGKTPFKSSDPMEIIHSHIAKAPPNPANIDPAIPGVISEMVIKLLSKGAEERYQNSFGLHADLQDCLHQLDNKGQIETFELAKKDVSIKFNIPQGIFGREKELSILMDAFKRISSGKSEIMLVYGQPGIGKSLLINEIHKPIVEKRGYFISGKYDQFRRDVPYSTLIQAFQSLVRQIISESREKINIWKEMLLKELGNNGRIITDVIPEVQLIIGEQKEIPVLTPEQSQKRFNIVFKNFIRVFATKEHPLVLFFDDIQWADYASLLFIKSIITDPDINYLLLIGSYRDTDVSSSHPLMLIIDQIKKEGAVVNSLSVPPLDIQYVTQLIMNFMRINENLTRKLSELIYKKTNGNPFFVNQFLKTLYDENLIELDSLKGWIWDLEKINRLQVTDNVVEMMAGKINKLPKPTQEIIKICSCIGNRFELETLSSIFGKSIEETLHDLSIAIEEGLVYLYGNLYRFYHDRIQEGAYSLISEKEKAELHYRIGKLTLKHTKKEDLKDKILYIVDQLNAGISLIASEEGKFETAQLNLQAGVKAKSAAAYESALNYLRTGIKLMGEDGWKKQYDLILSLYLEAVESAYLSTYYEEMERLSEKALKHTRSRLDEIRIYTTQINTLLAQNRLVDAIMTGLKVLRLLGVRFPIKPNILNILSGFIRTKILLAGKKIESLQDLPMMMDNNILSIMRILSSVSSAAYFSLPNFLSLIIFKSIFFSIKYGNSFISPFVYAGYGLALCSLGDIDHGYQFGKLALNLTEKIQQKEYKSKTIFTVNTFINHWKEHIRKTMEPLLSAYQIGLETGDVEFAAHSIGNYCSHAFFIGQNLELFYQQSIKYGNIVEKLKQEVLLIWMKMLQQTLLNLMVHSQDPCQLKGECFDEDKVLPVLLKAEDRNIIFSLYQNKMILCYFFQNDQEALKYAVEAQKYIDAMAGQVNPFYFYDSLIRISNLEKVKRNKRKQFLKKIKKNQKILKKWSDHAPMNFLHKYYLVEAELAGLKGNDLKAMDYYDRAVQGAKQNEYINDEAVANELAARFYLKIKKENIARLYMTEAYNNYYRWGAYAKSKELENKYPNLIASFRRGKRTRKTDLDLSINEAVLETLDLSTIIKASKALSSEIELGPLLEKIMMISIENAGAQKGVLILCNENDNKFYIEAEGEIDKKIEPFKSLPVEESNHLPVSVINFVAKTIENVVLEDACRKGPFLQDPYISNNQIKSILCAPIIDKGSIIGIIYLENNLLNNAFTPERLELLRILSSQAAISINNTRLVERERQNAALQKEIEMAQKIQNSLLPANIPDIKNVEIAFKYVPMTGIGGDFISVFYDEKGQKLGLFICDVSGHGVPAALTASMISMALDFFWKKQIDHPSKVLMEMKNNLKEKMGGNFFTASICVLNLADGELINASAGHPPVFIIRNNKNIESVQSKGGLISDFIDLNVQETKVKLKKGDMIILYTDGITEAENPDKVQLGTDDEKFKDWVKNIAVKSSSISQFCQDIFDNVITFTQKETLHDDFTLLAVKYNR